MLVTFQFISTTITGTNEDGNIKGVSTGCILPIGYSVLLP